MMREILFRAKHSDPYDTHGWYYGYYERADNTYHYIITENGSIIPINPRTVGQYTGFKDRNDIRIFEGDIVRCYDKIECYDIGCIYWDDKISSFRRTSSSCLDPRFHSFDYPLSSRCEYEVIGNIYDNPELLKGENK